MRAVIKRYYPEESYLLGGTATILDMRNTVRADDSLVDKLALLSIGLVLLLNFRSLILPFILLLTIKFSVWINLSIPYFTDQPVFYIVSLIINAIMLGATVDYAILFTTRYMQERRCMRRMDAIAALIAGTTSAIMTSASIMAVGGLSLGLMSGVDIVGQLGVMVGRGALISKALGNCAARPVTWTKKSKKRSTRRWISSQTAIFRRFRSSTRETLSISYNLCCGLTRSKRPRWRNSCRRASRWTIPSGAR